jgi:outer membrane protein assembly factor BamB
MSTDEPQLVSPPADASDRRGRHRLPSKWIWLAVAVIGILGAVVQGTDLLRDHALANIATCVLVFVAMATLATWFLFFSGFSWRCRLLVLGGCAVGMSLFAVLFRIERFSGEMLPSFAYRFSARPDWLLQSSLPQLADGKGKVNVDLRTTTETDFPQFLGPTRSNSVVHVSLARNWSDQSPKCIWRHAIGAGWSAFAAVNWHAVTMEQRGQSEMVTCYSIQTGQLEWAYATAVRYENLQGGVGPRSTPTISEGMVYALGTLGHLVCLDGATGKCLWEKDLLREYGVTSDEETAAVPWGRAGSPLVVGDRVIVPAGGTKDKRFVSLAAYDKRHGTKVWEGGNRQISYSSPALVTLAGAEQIVIVNEDTLSGHNVQTGKLLWEHPWPGRANANPNICQAVPISPNRVFVSKGYGRGAMLIELAPSAGSTFATQVVWSHPTLMKTKFANVATLSGYVYGLSDGVLECLDLAHGSSKWKAGRYGHGQLLRADDLLLVLSENGEVVLVEATPDRPNHVLGRFQAIEGMTWNSIALYGPYLLVRNADEAACYKLPLAERR